MTEYPLDYQYSMCITWFFLGEGNGIAEFTTGGSILPDIIVKNAADNEVLVEYFNNLLPSTEIKTNPFLDKYVNPKHILEPSKYGYYAKRGLISFDKIDYGAGDHSIDYHLIAQPVKGIDFHTLPEPIQAILLKFRQPINFEDFYKIDAGYAPWASLFTDYWVPFSYDATLKKKKGFWSLFTNS